MTKFLRTLLISLIGVSALFLVPAASAASPTKVGTYKDWKVYTHDIGGDTICFALAKPKSQSPKSVNHGDVFFMVASWKSGVATQQPSLMAGYDLRSRPEPTVRIGGSDKWKMFVSQTEGFIEQASAEKRLVSSMRRGSNMRVTAVSQRGTQTNYTFSLLGISAALERASKACK